MTKRQTDHATDSCIAVGEIPCSTRAISHNNSRVTAYGIINCRFRSPGSQSAGDVANQPGVIPRRDLSNRFQVQRPDRYNTSPYKPLFYMHVNEKQHRPVALSIPVTVRCWRTAGRVVSSSLVRQRRCHIGFKSLDRERPKSSLALKLSFIRLPYRSVDPRYVTQLALTGSPSCGFLQ